jgi:hypothetical protein
MYFHTISPPSNLARRLSTRLVVFAISSIHDLSMQRSHSRSRRGSIWACRRTNLQDRLAHHSRVASLLVTDESITDSNHGSQTRADAADDAADVGDFSSNPIDSVYPIRLQNLQMMKTPALALNQTTTIRTMMI